MAKLFAPNGAEIVATRDMIPACPVPIVNSGVTKLINGTYEFHYAGRTEVNWDGQVTEVDMAGHRLFFDENGDTWSENQLELRADDDDEEGEGE